MTYGFRSLIQFLIVFFILFAYRQFQGGFVSNFLFFSFLGVVVFESWSFLTLFIGFYGKRTFLGERHIAGENLDVTIRVTSRMPLPLCWLRLEENVPNKVEPSKRRPTFFYLFLFRRQAYRTYTLPSMPRGEHTFSLMQWEGGSLFGLITMRGTIFSEETVRVLPRLLDMGWFKQQGMLNLLHSVRAQDELEWSDVREYQPGDKLSRIHWKVSARIGTWMTMRTLTDDRDKNLMLVLDTSYSAYADDAQFEKAVSLAATFERWARHNGYAVGLITVEGRTWTTIPPGHDPFGQLALERVLVRIERTTAPWEKARIEDSRYRHEAAWVVITGKAQDEGLRTNMGAIVPLTSSKVWMVTVENMRIRRLSALRGRTIRTQGQA